MKRIIFVLGGVVSSLGKGLVTASISALLKASGYSVLTKKIDPYFNRDSGTLSPNEHGEVFVTNDGGETDLDLGHYERFTCEELQKISSITAGKVYMNVLNKERTGDYGGKTIQIIPHITEEIKEQILDTKNCEYDFIVIEVGGTVGDLESEVFLEAIMHIRSLEDEVETMIIHTSLLPILEPSKEIKTKPTQHSVKQLHIKGIHPDILILRYSKKLDIDSKEIQKISYLTGVKDNNIFVSYTIKNIYLLPLVFYNQNIMQTIWEKFNLESKKVDLEYLKKFKNMISNRKKKYRIAIVGKYKMHDAYLSIVESIFIASAYTNKKTLIEFIDPELVTETNCVKQFSSFDGIIVPPGFGVRGHKGKMIAAKYARENNIPFLGICFGMQMAILEFLKNKCGIDATSKEFTNIKGKDYAITLLEGRHPLGRVGGTLRLGNYKCLVAKNTLAFKLYGKEDVVERHRHRYEINNNYKDVLIKNGIVISGINEKLNLIEIIEIPKNKFFLACQFHPEYKTNIKNPHPFFKGFVEAL